MTPAVGCLETTPADGDRVGFDLFIFPLCESESPFHMAPEPDDRSYPDAGDPLFAGRQIHGGASEADLMGHSIIPNNEHIPDAATDPKYGTHWINNASATLRGVNTCAYGPALNPDVPTDDSENIIVVPGWKKRRILLHDDTGAHVGASYKKANDGRLVMQGGFRKYVDQLELKEDDLVVHGCTLDCCNMCQAHFLSCEFANPMIDNISELRQMKLLQNVPSIARTRSLPIP
uniref:Uncharacterized protein n=1 Tax=Aegilops tauschii TaxID=37682 RepID=N1QQ31_AEGTA